MIDIESDALLLKTKKIKYSDILMDCNEYEYKIIPKIADRLLVYNEWPLIRYQLPTGVVFKLNSDTKNESLFDDMILSINPYVLYNLVSYKLIFSCEIGIEGKKLGHPVYVFEGSLEISNDINKLYSEQTRKKRDYKLIPVNDYKLLNKVDMEILYKYEEEYGNLS